MRLSLHTDYALRALIYLAGIPGRSTTEQIAQFYTISKDHVAKVIQQLARLGYVRSIRGVGGGVELSKPAEEIRIGQVILDLEGNVHLLECVGTDNVCTIQPDCRLRGIFAEAERIQMAYLLEKRLSDVVQPGGQLVELNLSTGEK